MDLISMKIAFDLDDTLIPGQATFPLEAQGVLCRLLAHEPLRKGTISLMKSLHKDGWDLWIYTTSFRSPCYVRTLFFLQGVRIRGVINQYHHFKRVRGCGQPYQDCSKYPPAFGIDLLVEESEGVWLESRRFGFEMVLVHQDDLRWADAVMAKAKGMSRKAR